MLVSAGISYSNLHYVYDFLKQKKFTRSMKPQQKINYLIITVGVLITYLVYHFYKMKADETKAVAQAVATTLKNDAKPSSVKMNPNDSNKFA